MPGGEETEIPSRKRVCVSTYVARDSLLLIPRQLTATLAPCADTCPEASWSPGQRAPFPSAAVTPTHSRGMHEG